MKSFDLPQTENNSIGYHFPLLSSPKLCFKVKYLSAKCHRSIWVIWGLNPNLRQRYQRGSISEDAAMMGLKDRIQIFNPELPTNVPAAEELPTFETLSPCRGFCYIHSQCSIPFLPACFTHIALHNLKYPFALIEGHAASTPKNMAGSCQISLPLSRPQHDARVTGHWQQASLLS